MPIANVVRRGYAATIASVVMRGYISLNAVAPTVTTTTLPAGAVGVAYSFTLQATGDVTITWDITVGVLPAGLSLSAAGVISGTPTTEESQAFTVRATNASGNDTQALTLAIGIASLGGGQARDGRRAVSRGMLRLVGRG
jgi:hypothetical protein